MRRQVDASSIIFLSRLFFFPLYHGKVPVDFILLMNRIRGYLGEIGACVEGRAENQVCVNACVICVHRGLVAIADMVSFWVKHKAELEHPRGR